jgi:hypothetical protein
MPMDAIRICVHTVITIILLILLLAKVINSYEKSYANLSSEDKITEEYNRLIESLVSKDSDKKSKIISVILEDQKSFAKSLTSVTRDINKILSIFIAALVYILLSQICFIFLYVKYKDINKSAVVNCVCGLVFLSFIGLYRSSIEDAIFIKNIYGIATAVVFLTMLFFVLRKSKAVIGFMVFSFGVSVVYTFVEKHTIGWEFVAFALVADALYSSCRLTIRSRALTS